MQAISSIRQTLPAEEACAPRPGEAASLAYLTKLFQRASETARIGVWECDLDGQRLRWTDVVYDIFDMPRGAPLDRSEIVQRYLPESRVRLEQVRSEAIRTGGKFTLDAAIETAKGRRKWIRISAAVEREGGVPVRIFGLKQDITEERSLAEQTRYLAEHDPLTGLRNRSLFQKKLTGLSRHPAASAALMLVDLDHFKEINDRFGHGRGDDCLREIAARLTRTGAGAQFVARIGGDEFALLFEPAPSRDELASVAAGIIAALNQPILSGNESLHLGASVGIAALATGTDVEAGSLFNDADLALYAAKAAGKGRFRFFDGSLRETSRERRRTIAAIEQALRGGELCLHFQPMVRLSDGALGGFEALLRWNAPEGRVLAPGDFQAAMDDPELSRRVSDWALGEALAQAGRWRAAGQDYRRLSVNVSAAQLKDADFAERLAADVAACGAPPGSIQVEITESVFLAAETGAVFAQLFRLKAAGLRLAMDDFGAGYGSLVHLRNDLIDVIKIDRAFVTDCLASPADAAVLECMLNLGARLGKEIVAGGVESRAQAEALRALGCPVAQGAYFASAAPAETALELIRTDWRFGMQARAGGASREMTSYP